VLGEYRELSGDRSPTVVVSTASPYKFPEDVLTSLLGGEAAEGLSAFECAEKLEKHTGVPVPAQIRQLQTCPCCIRPSATRTAWRPRCSPNWADRPTI
jgi:threonine synthase